MFRVTHATEVLEDIERREKALKDDRENFYAEMKIAFEEVKLEREKINEARYTVFFECLKELLSSVGSRK